MMGINYTCVLQQEFEIMAEPAWLLRDSASPFFSAKVYRVFLASFTDPFAYLLNSWFNISNHLEKTICNFNHSLLITSCNSFGTVSPSDTRDKPAPSREGRGLHKRTRQFHTYMAFIPAFKKDSESESEGMHLPGKRVQHCCWHFATINPFY